MNVYQDALDRLNEGHMVAIVIDHAASGSVLMQHRWWKPTQQDQRYALSPEPCAREAWAALTLHAHHTIWEQERAA